MRTGLAAISVILPSTGVSGDVLERAKAAADCLGPAGGSMRTGLAAVSVILLSTGVSADVLEQAKAAARELPLQTASAAPRQRSFARMMTGLGLAAVGARLLWYSQEDKDCATERTRCAWIAAGGVSGLASGLLLMTVLADVPASPAVSLSLPPGGGAVRAVIDF